VGILARVPKRGRMEAAPCQNESRIATMQAKTVPTLVFVGAICNYHTTFWPRKQVIFTLNSDTLIPGFAPQVLGGFPDPRIRLTS